MNGKQEQSTRGGRKYITVLGRVCSVIQNRDITAQNPRAAVRDRNVGAVRQRSGENEG